MKINYKTIILIGVVALLAIMAFSWKSEFSLFSPSEESVVQEE